MQNALSLAEIAEKTNLSKSTISRALKNSRMISLETRNRVFQLAAEMGYVPDSRISQLASTLSRKQRTARPRSNVVSLVFYGRSKSEILAVEYYNRISCLLHDAFEQAGLSVIESYPRTQDEYLRLLGYADTDANLILSNIQSITPDFLPKLKVSSANRPLIFISNYIKGHDHEFHSVRGDNVSIGYMAARYFLDKGIRRILFIDPLYNMALLDDRFDGYCRALNEAGLSPERVLYSHGSAMNGGLSGLESGFDLPDGPVGILLGGDSLVYHFSSFLKERGLLRPDVLLAGMDGVPSLSANDPRSASVAIDMPALAHAAVRLVDDVLEGRVREPQRILVGAKIIERF